MSDSPWSVKGVEYEAREAAKLAARKAGVPLGAWLSQTIHAAAAQQLKSSSHPPHHPASAGFYGTPPNGYGYGANGHGMGAPTGARPPALTPEAVLESINRLASKIEETESRTAETLAPIVDRMNKLSEQMSEVRKDRSIETDPLERAMMRMSERLDRIEGGDDRRGRRTGEDERASSDRPNRRQGFFARLFSL